MHKIFIYMYKSSEYVSFQLSKPLVRTLTLKINNVACIFQNHGGRTLFKYSVYMCQMSLQTEFQLLIMFYALPYTPKIRTCATRGNIIQP